MKKFTNIEEQRAYYAEAVRKCREKQKRQSMFNYDPDNKRIEDVRDKAVEMHGRGVSLIMIWAALNVSWKELADILQITISPAEKHAFFNS